MSGYKRQCTDLNLERGREGEREREVRITSALKQCSSHFQHSRGFFSVQNLLVSPRGVLLHRESSFHVDDVPLVLKHAVTQCDLKRRETKIEMSYYLFTTIPPSFPSMTVQ